MLQKDVLLNLFLFLKSLFSSQHVCSVMNVDRRDNECFEDMQLKRDGLLNDNGFEKDMENHTQSTRSEALKV